MQRVGGAGDLSIDVRGLDETGRTVLVQCKRHAATKRVGSPAIQQFYGMCHYHDPSALPIFVTTADYSADARTVARKAGVRLIDGPDLVALALRARALQRPSGSLVDAQVISPRGELGR
jgi:restriction endonuclease Mrr